MPKFLSKDAADPKLFEMTTWSVVSKGWMKNESFFVAEIPRRSSAEIAEVCLQDAAANAAVDARLDDRSAPSSSLKHTLSRGLVEKHTIFL